MYDNIDTERSNPKRAIMVMTYEEDFGFIYGLSYSVQKWYKY